MEFLQKHNNENTKYPDVMDRTKAAFRGKFNSFK